MINRLELQLDNKSCSYWIVTSRFELPLVDLNYDKLLEFTSQLDISRRINLIKMSSLKSSQIEVIYHDSPTWIASDVFIWLELRRVELSQNHDKSKLQCRVKWDQKCTINLIVFSLVAKLIFLLLMFRPQ